MANTTGKKFGGREAGTPNRMSTELRTALKNILQDEIQMLPEHFKRLDPKDRIELLVKILPYAVPKVDSAGFNLGEESIEDSWGY